MRATRWRLPFTLLFAALLPRCIVPVETVEATLEEVEGPSVEVQLLSVSRGGTLRLSYDSVKGRHDCLAFKGGKARLNGVELEQLSVGGGTVLGLFCEEPTWLFPTPPETEAVSEFEINDPTGQLLYGVSSLAAKRSVAVRAAHPPIVPGGPLTFAWSPATDQLAVGEVRMEYEKLLPPHVAVRNGRLGFLVPPRVSTGTQEVVLDLSVHPGTAHCEPDPDRCTGFLPAELVSGTTFVKVTVQ